MVRSSRGATPQRIELLLANTLIRAEFQGPSLFLLKFARGGVLRWLERRSHNPAKVIVLVCFHSFTPWQLNCVDRIWLPL